MIVNEMMRSFFVYSLFSFTSTEAKETQKTVSNASVHLNRLNIQFRHRQLSFQGNVDID